MVMKLTESLEQGDMAEQLTPTLTIDEFSSRTGSDSDIITLAFILASKMAAEDLVNWFERGYEWIIDAEVSPGQVLDKKYYVFAELNRRSSAPKRIIELLDDLKTLTNKDVDEWTIKLEDHKFPATLENLSDKLVTNPAEYKNRNERELNELREIAGIKTVTAYNTDSDILAWQHAAGIK